jgi:hypothetical protein
MARIVERRGELVGQADALVELAPRPRFSI